MAGRPGFRRVILSLGPDGVDRQMLKAVADFACLLELEMVGIFVEDESVLGLEGLPFLRELRLPGRAWHPFDPVRVSDELRAAAQQAKRLLEEEGTARGMACRFEVRRGDPASLASAVGELTDIVVVCEPVEAVGWLSMAVSRARRSAFTSPASVLFLPPSVIAHRGPIAAVASARSEPAVALAARVAEAAGEEMVFVPAGDRSAGGIATLLDQALGLRRERLTVMSRGSAESEDAVVALVAQRGAPVLVIEPDLPGASERPAKRL